MSLSFCFVVFPQGDEDLLTVHIGEIFLEFVNMLPAFQTYCLQQSTSVNMLNTLEKEKELLRYCISVTVEFLTEQTAAYH